MKPVVLLVILTLLTGCQTAQYFPTKLHIDRNVACDAEHAELLTRMPREANKPVEIQWIAKHTAEVQLKGMDDIDLVISERAPRAKLTGTDLWLCYNYMPMKLIKPGTPVLACGTPNKLLFTISNLPKAKYNVYATTCWPPG